MRVVIVGATGLIGRHVIDALRARGDEALPLSRGSTTVGGVPTVRWEPSESPMPSSARDGSDAIVNLAGAPLTAGRWSPARKRAIQRSRIDATRGVVAALGDGGPAVLVNASGAGYYGSAEVVADEHAPPGDDFLARVCVEWEREALTGADRARVAIVRSGVVLAREGGALPLLLRIARLGLLGSLGSGRQWVPWIHLDDEVAGILHCIDRPEVSGPVNLVAPRAVRQAEFARRLRGVVRRPPAPRVPGVVVRAALGEAAELVLRGQRASPSVLIATGFGFEFPELDAALRDLVPSAPPRAGAGAPSA